MQAPPPPVRRSNALKRYAPFLAIALVIVLVAVFLGGRKSGKSNTDKTNGSTGSTSALPITYAKAQADGTTSNYTWQSTCDPKTGKVAIPIREAAPCVPAFHGANGGATAPGVSAKTITIAFYVSKPDPATDAL